MNRLTVLTLLLTIILCRSTAMIPDLDLGDLGGDDQADIAGPPPADAGGLAGLGDLGSLDAPEPDAAPAPTVTPTPAPTSVATATPTPATATPVTSAGPAGPTIKPEQLTGDTVLELEKTKPLIQGASGSQVSLFNQTKELVESMIKALDQVEQEQSKLQENFTTLETQLDQFYQEAAYTKGKLIRIFEAATETTQPTSKGATPLPKF